MSPVDTVYQETVVDGDCLSQWPGAEDKHIVTLLFAGFTVTRRSVSTTGTTTVLFAEVARLDL